MTSFVFRFATLEGNKVLQLDPAVDGVFKGPYPIGIDPVIFLLLCFVSKTIGTSCIVPTGKATKKMH